MPNLTRKPKPAPGRIWRLIDGFAADVPDYGPWAPRIGDTFRSDHPGIAHLAALGALGRFLVDAGADTGGATTPDILAARAAEQERRDALENTERDPAIRPMAPIPPERQRVCTRTIFRGMARLCDPGTILDVDDWRVTAHPDYFEPVAVTG
jgi:hypothetical protein